MDASEGSTGFRPMTDFKRPAYCVLGLLLDAVDRKEAIERISAASTVRQCFLSTPNMTFLSAIQTDAVFRDSIIRSDLSVADGMPLVWIASMLGTPIRKRVAGSDLFEAFMKGSGRSLNVYFFGGADGVAEEASKRLNAMAGPMRCVGYASPGFGSVEQMSEPRYLTAINHSGADLVAVSIGLQRGHLWIERNRAALDTAVVSYLGAMVNFVAGSVSRAPVFLQRLGLEWLWRIKEEPGLWRRYWHSALLLGRLLLTRVLPAMVHKAFADTCWRRDPARLVIEGEAEAPRLMLAGRWTESELPMLREAFERITRRQADISIGMEELGSVDQAFIGCLMLLYSHQSKSGCELNFSLVSAATRRIFHLNCAEFLLDGLRRPSGK